MATTARLLFAVLPAAWAASANSPCGDRACPAESMLLQARTRLSLNLAGVHDADRVQGEDGPADVGVKSVPGKGPVSQNPSAEDYWYQETILELHNYFRCLHGAPALAWSRPLEKNAKSWAAKGRGSKSPPYYRSDIGEFKLAGENVANQIANATDLRDGVAKWYAQMPLPKGIVSEGRWDTSAYTQMIWRSTTDIGCGIWFQNFICHYGPAGNIEGEFEKEVSPLSLETPKHCKAPTILHGDLLKDHDLKA
mmetsp:Transcript_114329/g.330274  ORF Transcript_114329/g.330274 Transcript_114329/m.330274 type:complete len:252 (+) Transcript_114329:73-828(+)